MLKCYFQNTEPNLLNYRDFKHFSQQDFKKDLKEALYDCGNSYDNFDRIFTAKLNELWTGQGLKVRLTKLKSLEIIENSVITLKCKIGIFQQL